MDPVTVDLDLLEKLNVGTFRHLAVPRLNRPKEGDIQVLQGFLKVSVTGQRSNQLNYIPNRGINNLP